MLTLTNPLLCRPGAARVGRAELTLSPKCNPSAYPYYYSTHSQADLVPREVAEQWLKYFREELPAVAFKSSTQKQVGAVLLCISGLGSCCGSQGFAGS